MTVHIPGNNESPGKGRGMKERPIGFEAPEWFTRCGIQGVKTSGVCADEDFSGGDDRFNGGSDSLVEKLSRPLQAERWRYFSFDKTCVLNIAVQHRPIGTRSWRLY